MKLKEFAEINGINYQTAKTWLRRGRIVETLVGEFRISETWLKPGEIVSDPEIETETLKPDANLLTPRDNLVTFEPMVLNLPTRDNSVTECEGCAELRARIEKLELALLNPPRLIDHVRGTVEDSPAWGA